MTGGKKLGRGQAPFPVLVHDVHVTVLHFPGLDHGRAVPDRQREEVMEETVG